MLDVGSWTLKCFTGDARTAVFSLHPGHQLLESLAHSRKQDIRRAFLTSFNNLLS
jgi:hypothetical protein